MALTFKKFAVAVWELPHTVLSGMSDIFFGATDPKEKDKNGKPKEYEGLFGTVLNGLTFVAKGISNFIRANKKAIVIGFWASLLIGGAVGLGLYLLPKTLAFVAAYEVYGFSILGLVGTNPIMQTVLAAGLAATATTAATIVIASVVNTITAIKNFFAPATTTSESSNSQDDGFQDGHGSFRKMADLHNTETLQNTNSEDVKPVHSKPVGSRTASTADEPVIDDTATCTL